MKARTAVITDGFQLTLSAPLTELLKSVLHVRERAKANVHGSAVRMACWRAAHIAVVGFRSPPIVDQTGFNIHGFQFFNQSDGFKRILPCAFIRMNQEVRLRVAVGALKNRITVGIGASELDAPPGRIRRFRAVGEKLLHFRAALIHGGDLLLARLLAREGKFRMRLIFEKIVPGIVKERVACLHMGVKLRAEKNQNKTERWFDVFHLTIFSEAF